MSTRILNADVVDLAHVEARLVLDALQHPVKGTWAYVDAILVKTRTDALYRDAFVSEALKLQKELRRESFTTEQMLAYAAGRRLLALLDGQQDSQ